MNVFLRGLFISIMLAILAADFTVIGMFVVTGFQFNVWIGILAFVLSPIAVLLLLLPPLFLALIGLVAYRLIVALIEGANP